MRTGMNTPGSDIVDRKAYDSDPSLNVTGCADTQIGGDATERRGQLVEVRELRVLQRDRIEQQVYLLPFIESAWQLEAPFQSELQLRRVGALVLLSSEVLVSEGRLTLENQLPVRAIQQRADLLGRQAGRVRATNEPAHAGPGDRVDRNPVFLQPLQKSDVGETARTAAAERQSETRT